MATLRGIPFDANEIILPDGTAGYDNILYSADFAEWLGTYFKNGILVPSGAMITTELKVTKVDSTHVSIAKGNMVVNGRTVFVPEAISLLTTATIPNTERWDRVVIELNLEENTNAFVLKFLIGTESNAPVAPDLIRTDEVYQMSLATVKQNTSGVYSIVDERSSEDLCGISQVLIGVKPPLPVTGDEATNIAYDNSSSGLDAINVQDAIDELKARVKTFTTTIPITSWNTFSTNSETYYKRVITVTGLLATDNPIIDVVASSTPSTAQKQLASWGSIFKATTAANQITFIATDIPEIAIPVQIKVVR